MEIIKIDAIGSTNSYLKDLLLKESLDKPLVVQTQDQFGGRGQRGNTWVSEPGKNLTFSVLWPFEGLPAQDQFQVNMAVSLALFKVLNDYELPDVKVKWPNDILSGNTKICGILIENLLRGPYLAHSIIGIGLNVNQRSFIGLPKANSMAGVMRHSYDLDTVLMALLMALEDNLKDIQLHGKALKQTYEHHLFRKGEPVVFDLSSGETLEGTIMGVTDLGQLRVLPTNGFERRFGFQEIKLRY
ncbi:biotin--[acetyl-CoA-carboxylase] ligase [Sediminicola luteus]|uniref:Biotin--[acetyl-CoA-carboxylase] ligase n=1 Tax=Sediminicola luteus TaxID=319238 RepID=A0A2A4G665_9FLAO|nr:biotin--[acetyl-CoA-carboxylase] ligase [Sediminicola luteus]PCE63478.1 biotin--[acetyl-CoA-carboxylase] ligase [Sediminicola luteus]